MTRDEGTKKAGMADDRFTMIRVRDLFERVQVYLTDVEERLVEIGKASDTPTRVTMLAEAVSGELAKMRGSLEEYRNDMPANVADTFVQFPLEPQDLPRPPTDSLTPHDVAAWLLQRTHFVERLFRDAGKSSTADAVQEALDAVALHVEGFARSVSRSQQSIAEI